MRRFILALAAPITFGVLLTAPAVAQTRLPPYAKSNSFVLGQVLGCAIRMEVYFTETQSRLAAAGKSLPATFQLATIAGLDVAALKADVIAEAQATATPEYPAEKTIAMITELAHKEYDGALGGIPGYNEAWAQSAGCVMLFSQFGLMQVYR